MMQEQDVNMNDVRSGSRWPGTCRSRRSSWAPGSAGARGRSRRRVQRLALPPDELRPEGIDVRQFLKIMGTRVGRSTLFGIPLQQQWSYANSGDFAPTYYLQTDAPLYYYSFTDAYIARPIAR